MKDETIGKGPRSLGGEITLEVVGVGSYLSSKIWILRPFPTLYLVPFLITSKLLWMLLQAYGGLLPFFELSTSSKGKYLALNTWAASESGFWRILQPYLASIARLKEGLV